MAHDPTLWQPATIPDNLDSPASTLSGIDPQLFSIFRAMWEIAGRANIRTSRALKILDKFRVIMDTDKPTASGSGVLWVDTTGPALYYDDPVGDGGDPVAYSWELIYDASGIGKDAKDTPTDTSGFTGLLSASDDDVQEALDTLDQHTHDHDALTNFVQQEHRLHPSGVTDNTLTRMDGTDGDIQSSSWTLADTGEMVGSNLDLSVGVTTDAVTEHTADAGVTIEEVLLKDGEIEAEAATIGDGTNQVSMSSVGLYLEGTATMWDDLRVPVLSVRVPAVGGPGFAKMRDDGNLTPSTGVFTYWFDKNTEESVFFMCQMPHHWKQGSDIECHVHWTPASNALAATDVCWGLEYTWANINGTFPTTSFLYGDEQSNGPTEVVSRYKHYLTELGTITGTGKTLSSMLVCRLFRDATGAGGTDDYNDDAGLLEIDFHYEVDSLGSKEEYTKGP